MVAVALGRRSRDGWSPTAEAVSLGNRDLLRYLLQRRNERARDKVALSLPTTFERLEAVRMRLAQLIAAGRKDAR